MHTFRGKSPNTVQILGPETKVIETFYVENPLVFRTFGADLRRYLRYITLEV